MLYSTNTRNATGKAASQLRCIFCVNKHNTNASQDLKDLPNGCFSILFLYLLPWRCLCCVMTNFSGPSVSQYRENSQMFWRKSFGFLGFKHILVLSLLWRSRWMLKLTVKLVSCEIAVFSQTASWLKNGFSLPQSSWTWADRIFKIVYAATCSRSGKQRLVSCTICFVWVETREYT